MNTFAGTGRFEILVVLSFRCPAHDTLERRCFTYRLAVLVSDGGLAHGLGVFERSIKLLGRDLTLD